MTEAFRNAAERYRERITERRNNPERFTPISLGLSELDQDLYGGVELGWLVFIAAYAKVGKTAFLTTINASLERQRLKIVRVSLEESNLQIVERQLSHVSRTIRGKLRIPSLLTEEEFTHALDKLTEMEDWYGTVLIDDVYDPDDLEKIVKELGAQVLIVDYTQLMRPNRNFGSEREMFSYVSKAFKRISKLGVLVIAALQLNDDGKDLGSRDPTRDTDVKYKLESVFDEAGTRDPSRIKVTVETSRHSQGVSTLLVFDGATSTIGDTYEGLIEIPLEEESVVVE